MSTGYELKKKIDEQVCKKERERERREEKAH